MCPTGQSCNGAGACTDGNGGCVPKCVDKECGDDGCEGSCGTCGDGELCAAGLCVDDGTGCPDGTILVDGECVPEGDEDVIGGGDTGVDIGGKVSSGCTVGTTPTANGAWLLLALMLGLVATLRMRREDV